MRKLLFNILCLFPLLCIAAPRFTEQVHLQWEPIQLGLCPGDSTPYLYFQEASIQKGLPFYHSQPLPTQHTNYLLNWEDCQWTICSPAEVQVLTNICEDYSVQISDTLYYKIFTRTRGSQTQIEWECLPLKLKDGQYYKLNKAQVTLNPLPQKKKETAPKYSFQESSVLKTGLWKKVSIRKTGVYKLTYAQLKEMGFEHPEGVRIYGYGGNILEENFKEKNARIADDLPEIPIYMEKGTDGQFNDGDYILFYGLGPIQFSYNDNKGTINHVQNPYSQEGYYFITTQDGEGKRITMSAPETAKYSLDIDKTLAYQFHEKEEYNIIHSGREWYGDRFQQSGTMKHFEFQIPYISNDKIKWEMEFIATSPSRTEFQIDLNDDTYQLYVNGSSNIHIKGKKAKFSRQLSPHMSGTQNLDIHYTCKNVKDYGYINFIALTATRQLTMDQPTLLIFYPGYYDKYTLAHYKLNNANAQTQIWEITHPLNVQQLPTQLTQDQLQFNALYHEHRAFLAVNPQANFPSPTITGTVENQNLHGTPQADMIIICDKEYFPQAQKLAQHHQDWDNLHVEIIEANQIFNEFSSGARDATAYRWFVKMLYDRAKTESERPKYLLFIGEASYDNRGILHPAPALVSYQSVESLVTTQSYVTDDYFGLLDDADGGHIASDEIDIAIGRFPVFTPQEAEGVVNKMINYATQPQLGTWKNEFTFLGDDEDGNIHMQQADGLAEDLLKKDPAYKVNKIFLDAYPMEQNASGAYYPKAKEELLRHLKEGTLVFTYVGHGSPNTLTTEQTITKGDIQYMDNKHLALWLTATCDFAPYDNGEHSAGIEVLTTPHAGLALYTTTRVVFSANNNLLAKAIYENLVPDEEGNTYTLGEIMRLAKKDLGNDQNKLNFCLLGDPALRLHYPQEDVKTLHINQVSPAEATLNALGLVSIEAQVYQDEVPDEDFNGTAAVTLYDKSEKLSTLSGKGNEPFVYKDFTNVLYSGNVQIVNGKIKFEFMVPKDINYQLGNGRLVYYIMDNTREVDGHGCESEFLVGGSSPDVEPAVEGPDMRIYLNSPQFINGQRVNNKPVFFAHLYDKNGINTVGAGIGHDLVLKLNNDPNQTIVLNSFYESNLNDYTSGRVYYPFQELPVGQYTLTFKAWNLQNISSTQTIHFIVQNGLDPVINDFSIYPNPIRTEATFSVSYDRPEENMNVNFEVYDLGGSLMWHKIGEYHSSTGCYQTQFNLQEAGANLSEGIYLVKVTITSSEGTFNYKTQKIVVLPQ